MSERPLHPDDSSSLARLRVVIHGAVQGVGFRPFVYRLATELGLAGWVLNSPQGVFIEVEGPRGSIDAFLSRLSKEKPVHAFIQSLESSYLDPAGYRGFVIRESDATGGATALVLPDIATCPDCLGELFNPANRRYLYPFTNCTNCGPRFSIIDSLPYDRPNTSMNLFELCPACRREYEDPRDRRFHAQPNACPECGPHVELWDAHGKVLVKQHLAVEVAAEVVRKGGILAVKGIGGFHLLVDARNNRAVVRLRERKHREEKPLALMFPSLESVKTECEVSEAEERLLTSSEAPIVLLGRSAEGSVIAPSVAPANPFLGVMLPYTPLHHILLRDLRFPVVATSGNLSDEPICIDEREALARLREIADVFLVHDRPILRHVDDSVVRVMAGRELVTRRARGYAPLPIRLTATHDVPILAVGAHLKNTVAFLSTHNVFVSQHIGDLETEEASEAFRKVIDDFGRLYQHGARHIAYDLHPDYLSTKYARQLGGPATAVQHHYAHVASCMAENELQGRVLGVSWDGTGYGLDGTIWGGEFLLTSDTSFDRVASLRTFRLPGGEAAIKEPRRAAIGALYEMLGGVLFEEKNLWPLKSFRESDLKLVRQMLERNVNAPLTSSMGRLFDAVASIVGLRQLVRFEGQAAMELEFAIGRTHEESTYQVSVTRGQDSIPAIIIDWIPMMREILDDLRRGLPVGTIAAKFHNTLAEIIVEVARRFEEPRVVLTGGCFQNKYLTERAVDRLRTEGFHPYWHQRIPPNDGGIALGQVFAVVRSRVTSQRSEVRQTVRESCVSEEETSAASRNG